MRSDLEERRGGAAEGRSRVRMSARGGPRQRSAGGASGRRARPGLPPIPRSVPRAERLGWRLADLMGLPRIGETGAPSLS